MSRLLRSFVCLVLIGSAGTGVFGMGLCICADGHVALEMGCHGGCQDAEDSPDCQQHGEAEISAGALADTGGDCVYLSLLSDAMLHSLFGARHSLSAKNLLSGSPQAGGPNDRADFDVRANASGLFRRTPLYTSASVLAQRTIVLRI